MRTIHEHSPLTLVNSVERPSGSQPGLSAVPLHPQRLPKLRQRVHQLVSLNAAAMTINHRDRLRRVLLSIVRNRRSACLLALAVMIVLCFWMNDKHRWDRVVAPGLEVVLFVACVDLACLNVLEGRRWSRTAGPTSVPRSLRLQFRMIGSSALLHNQTQVRRFPMKPNPKLSRRSFISNGLGSAVAGASFISLGTQAAAGQLTGVNDGVELVRQEEAPSRELISGDANAGNDCILLSGDANEGASRILLSGDTGTGVALQIFGSGLAAFSLLIISIVWLRRKRVSTSST